MYIYIYIVLNSQQKIKGNGLQSTVHRLPVTAYQGEQLNTY